MEKSTQIRVFAQDSNFWHPAKKNAPPPWQRFDEIDKSQPVFTICQMGKTSYFSARILANHGIEAHSIR